MNLVLKIAIVQSGKSQTIIAKEAGLNDTKLSRIVHEHDQPTDDEKKAIAKAVKRKSADLFTEQVGA